MTLAHPGPVVLAARGLTHAYGQGATRSTVLRQVTVGFSRGELTLILGASGSGKSTLLAVLGGLLRPDVGEVTLEGVSVWSQTARALETLRRRKYAYIFQGFNLFSALVALDQVALPLRLGGESRNPARERAAQALAEVGLSRRLHLRPAELSGGEKQRVAIARALVTCPQVLLADEPTSALDSANGERVIALLQDIAHQHGAVVIAVTHDARLKRHAERVLELGDGIIVEDRRTPEAVA